MLDNFMAWCVFFYLWSLGVGGVGGVYDEALVRRVMLLFSFDCLDCCYDEVRSMNVGKVGDTFKYFFGCSDECIFRDRPPYKATRLKKIYFHC